MGHLFEPDQPTQAWPRRDSPPPTADRRASQTVGVPAGKTIDPADQITAAWQRSSGALTVQVFGGSFHGPRGQQTLIALTNAAWTAVVG